MPEGRAAQEVAQKCEARLARAGAKHGEAVRADVGGKAGLAPMASSGGFWWNRFGPMFAAEIRKRRVAHMRGYPQWRWHLDEAFVKVNGKLCYLWRALDHEGEVLEAVVTAKRDKAAALKFLKRIMKKYGRPLSVVTDGFCSYPAAMKEIGNADRQEAGRRLNNRAENSHQPFRRRERAMQRFRSMKTLQKFSSVHAQLHNHFNQERHLVTRQVYKQRRSAALAEWRALAA